MRSTVSKGFAPLFLDRGLGARVWDVDGNEYVDLIGGLLTNVLGYCDPDINLAIKDQLDRGISFSLATELELQLAKKLNRLIPCAEKVRFAKNGSDATTGCIRVARAATKKNIIICTGYHGWHDWYLSATTRDDCSGCLTSCGRPHSTKISNYCLKRLAHNHGAIFDEVVTGFRL